MNRSGLPFRSLQLGGLGLLSGVGFLLPPLALRLAPAGQIRTVAMLVALGVAVLLVRRLGRVVHGLLDQTDRPLRFPLLILYAVAVMAAPLAILVLPSA